MTGGFSRGFIITFDAATALLLFFVALTIISTQTFQPVAPGGTYLKQMTLDAMAVMEKNRALGMAIDGNTTGVDRIMQATPDLMCMQVSISNGANNPVATISKSGCDKVGKERQATMMGFAHGGNNYLIAAQSWYKKQ